MNFVQVSNLTKKYSNTVILNDLNLTIEKGEFITLLGPSGCGKSTLLRSIAGLTDIETGEIIIDGRNITDLNPKERNISMVFQSYALFPNMTAKENIAFGLKMKKISKEEIETKVKKIIELVDLMGKEDFYPRQLSGGQQQRVALARALVVEPKILLLDEPLSALDAKIRKNLRLQIRRIQKELDITTIFVTHDQEEALIISDRIFLMDKGNFSQIGTPKEIYTSPKNEFVARFMGNYNVLKKEDIHNIIRNSNMEFEGNVFAIRPEAIILSEPVNTINNHDGLNFSGNIKEAFILGNILRYQIETEKNMLTVDILNRENEKIYLENQNVNIFIPYCEIKKLA